MIYQVAAPITDLVFTQLFRCLFDWCRCYCSGGAKRLSADRQRHSASLVSVRTGLWSVFLIK